MRTRSSDDDLSRRRLIAGAVSLGGAALLVEVSTSVVLAKDYTSRREALDELDRLGAICGMRLGEVGRARASSGVLVSRFLRRLGEHKERRDAARLKFGLPRGADPASQLGEADAELDGLRKALDDLMVAYAESLPVFGDSSLVSGFAIDMVNVAKMRTVVDLWATAEEQ